MQTLTRDRIRDEIIRALGKDDRTFGHMAAISDAIDIVESYGITPSGWQLSLLSTAKFPQPVQDAIQDTQAAAHEQWRIELPPLGASTIP